MNKIFKWGATALALLVLIGFGIRRASHSEPSHLRSTPEQATPSAAEPEVSRSLSPRLAKGSAASVVTVSDRLGPEAGVTATPDVSERNREREHRHDLEQYVREEPRDGAWAQTAEHDLHTRLQQREVKGLARTHVYCATTLCRLDLSFEQTEDREEGVRHAAAAVPWAFRAYYHAADNEPRHVTMYVTREGERMPGPDNG